MGDSIQRGERSCRECGCTDERGCPGGCWWVLPDVCRSCAAALLVNAGLDATPVLLGGHLLAALAEGGVPAGILDEILAVDPARAGYERDEIFARMSGDEVELFTRLHGVEALPAGPLRRAAGRVVWQLAKSERGLGDRLCRRIGTDRAPDVQQGRKSR